MVEIKQEDRATVKVLGNGVACVYSNMSLSREQLIQQAEAMGFRCMTQDEQEKNLHHGGGSDWVLQHERDWDCNPVRMILAWDLLAM